MTPYTRPDNDGVAQLEELSRAECMDYLAGAQVGRVAVVVDGYPAIFPVNFIIDGQEILFRTHEGTKLSEASLTRVAFEVDHVDTTTRQGWSVLVQGQADDIGNAVDATSQRLRARTLDTWAPGDRNFWFAIRPFLVSGRRFRVLPLEL